MSEESKNTTENYEWCLVGNIIDKHFYGENKEIRSGTKHFRAEAKVYCLLEYGGMGHERIRVIGLHRKSKRMIDITIDSELIKNMRLQKVYISSLVEKIQNSSYFLRFSENDRIEKMQNFAYYFNTLPNREINSDLGLSTTLCK